MSEMARAMPRRRGKHAFGEGDVYLHQLPRDHKAESRLWPSPMVVS